MWITGARRKLNSRYGGDFKMFVYTNQVAYAEHVALVKGDIAGDGPVMVRMHALNVLDDVFGDNESGKSGELQQAMQMIADEGRGVLVMIREPHRCSFSDRVRARLAAKEGKSKPPSVPGTKPGALRDYGVGAQILLDLGVKEMILLPNTQHTIIGLEGYNLTIAEQRPIKPLKQE